MEQKLINTNSYINKCCDIMYGHNKRHHDKKRHERECMLSHYTSKYELIDEYVNDEYIHPLSKGYPYYM